MVFSAVMQAPIGPASTPELVSTVCAAGGLGTLAASWTPPSRLRAQIHELQRLTDAPFCVNLVLAFDQRERLEILIEEHVAFVSFSWGVDSQSIAYAKDAGLSVLVQVGEPEAGIQAVAAGADGLIAQGTEAGGHVEATTTVTRLVGTLSRAAVLRAATSDSVLTGLFDIGWPDAPHRVLRNDTLNRWETTGRPLPGRRPGEGQVIASRRGRPVVRYSDEQPTRHTEGDIESMALYAGTSVGAVHRIDDAAAITERLLAATAAI